MHAQLDVVLPALGLHAREIVIKNVEVDQQLRRVEVVEARNRGHGESLSGSENVRGMIRLHGNDVRNIQYAEFASCSGRTPAVRPGVAPTPGLTAGVRR